MNDSTGTDGTVRNSTYDDEVRLSQLLLVTWRYRIVLLGITLAAGAVALLVGWNRTPTYLASSTLLVTAPRVDDIATRAVGFDTCVALVTNPSHVLKTMEELGLTRPPHLLSPSQALQRNIAVQPLPESRTIVVTTRLPDPALAARFANRLAERAIELAQKVARDDIVAVRDTLQVQTEEARKRLAEADQRLEEYRKQAQLEALTAELDVLLQQRAKQLGTRAAAVPRATELARADAARLNDLYNRQANIERLETEVKVARRVYLDVSTSHEKARLRLAATQAPMQILDAAVPPDRPVARRIVRGTVLAAIAGLIVAAGGVLLYAGMMGKLNASPPA
jgi:uncharacterized protein involved in exopolysaccharide biosynthesis